MKSKIQPFSRAVALAIAALASVLAGAAGLNAQTQTLQLREARPVAVTGDLVDIASANDGNEKTRAYAGKPDYSGLSVTLDMGGDQNIVGVIQDHGPWSNDYPGSYRVDVGLTPNGPWLKAFEGQGKRGESRSIFDAVRGRYIRITATGGQSLGKDWSLAEFRVGVDPGAKPRIIPSETGRNPSETGRNTSGPIVPGAGLKNFPLALDRKQDTRATTETADYTGVSFTHDLGGEYEISRVVQVHGQWAEDYPGEYKVEVSRRKDESAFREVWRGRGEAGRSVASFDPVATRYIRVTAIRPRDRNHPWSIAELRTNRDTDVVDSDEDDKRLDRPVRRATAQGFSDINLAIDDSPATRASTGRANYIGDFVMLDLGGSYTVSKVTQIHDPDDRDFPARYKVEVSEDGSRWRQVYEGEGQNGRSRANFDSARARFVRITATDDRNSRRPWSISKIRVSG
ncbi:MAG TPA: discoidin domain-containing protein [Blastocatellia bacterium]|jgi:hypothetical protein|nr:discoidin domain-containing protein [Blastocatellia bacterium]